MRTRGILAGVALVVSIPACTSGSGSPHVSAISSASMPTASASVVRLGSRVAVSVSGIKGEAGSQLAGVLFVGSNTSLGSYLFLTVRSAHEIPSHPIGGFATSVDADPFSTTQIVHQPSPYTGPGKQFPFVSPAVLRVLGPGTYTILLYVGPKLRPIPYSHWRPWGTPGLRGCKMTFFVEDGEGNVIVRMHDPALAKWSGNREDGWAPWHLHPPSCTGQ